jgi:hypothetical protein
MKTPVLYEQFTGLGQIIGPSNVGRSRIMGATPSDGKTHPPAPAEPRQAARVRPRSSTRRTQERRLALIIAGCMLGLGGMITAVVVVTASPKTVIATNSPPAVAPPENELRTAKITTNSDGNGCWQKVFDNQTGRMLRSQKPCEAAAYDINGAPAPLGTIHRLDAISKSFTSH